KGFDSTVYSKIYSLRSAITGSLFAAFLDGIIPAIKESTKLNPTNATAVPIGKEALIVVIPVREWIIEFVGINNKLVIPIPNTPDNKPMINVSALNICEIFDLDAPMARRIPISFVRSITDI